MPTEVLKDMIRQDCLGGEEESVGNRYNWNDLDIISEREPEQVSVDIDVLWNDFQCDYLPDIFADCISENIEKEKTDSMKKEKENELWKKQQ